MTIGLLALAAVVAALAILLSSADRRYRWADALFERGHFETALFVCEQALQRDPRHRPARALFTELQFILGRGKATPYNGEYDRFMGRSSASGP